MMLISKSSFFRVAVVFLLIAGCSRLDAQAPEDKAQKDQASHDVADETGEIAAAVRTAPPGKSASALLQIGPWSPFPANTEEPYINIFRASSVTWKGGGMSTQELYDAGHISSVTGLPVSLPNRKTLTTEMFITGEPKTFYDGDCVLEWDGDADLGLLYFPDHLITQRRRGRIEFTRDAASGASPYHMAIQVFKVRSPVTALRLFRKQNETALRTGKIFNPRFIEEIRKYHIVRTMDLQEVNRSFITNVDEVATLDACCWGNIAWTTPPRKLDHPFRSMPLEAVFALAVEADNALWHTAPIELGSPKRLYDPSVKSDNNDAVAGGFRNIARENADAILASSEWDRYADRFVEALISSGYPSNRKLYTTVSNEVWNTAFHYFVSTNYAWGLGLGIDDNGIFRNGYGAALARWKLALDGALARADRDQEVIYVVESQAADPSTTSRALRAAKKFMEMRGENWVAHSPDIGVSVASYWGGLRNWFEVLPPDQWGGAGEADAAALENRIINGPAKEVATKAWVLAKFAGHAREAAPFGVTIIGAYEGGSHLEKPYEVPRSFYASFVWGPHGARVNMAVNDALAEAYPGIILSNYVLSGQTGGQPWFDGPYNDDIANDNDMQRSWEVYQRR